MYEILSKKSQEAIDAGEYLKNKSYTARLKSLEDLVKPFIGRRVSCMEQVGIDRREEENMLRMEHEQENSDDYQSPQKNTRDSYDDMSSREFYGDEWFDDS